MPLNPEQLEAAVYAHDLGVSFVGDDDSLKIDLPDHDGQPQSQTHPLLSSQLLTIMPGWKEAATIVEQHHERMDGKGYPAGLKGNEICAGAKLLSLAIAFDDMLNLRHKDIHKRSLLRVIADINANAGALYDKEVVEAFNEMIKTGYPSRKKTHH